MLKNDSPFNLTIDVCSCEGSVVILNVTTSIGFAQCNLKLRNSIHRNLVVFAHCHQRLEGENFVP
jgi:hypothetical protein